MIKEQVMSKYLELRKINVNEHTEKKGKFTYLSWAWAVDQLLQADPMATWEYQAPMQFGETLMVFCTVSAFGKTMTSQLPVLNAQNKAIVNPDAFAVNTAMQRCLAKAIALHGIGLYIYAGEDIPNEEPIDITELMTIWTERILQAKDMEGLKAAYTLAYEDVKKDKSAIAQISKIKDIRKGELMAVQS